jgi:hypothetical protein
MKYLVIIEEVIMIVRVHRISASLSFRQSASILLVCLSLPGLCHSMNSSPVSSRKVRGCFTLSASGKSASLVVGSAEYSGVIRAAKMFQEDVERVTAHRPRMTIDSIPESKEVVLIGTLGRSPLIDQLAESGKIKVDDIAGKWESTLIQVPPGSQRLAGS